jgi:hypothetical protein
MWYSNLGKHLYLSTYPPPTSIRLSHCFTNASKPTAQKYFDCCLSQFRTSVLWSATFECRWENFSLHATNTSHRKQETFLYEYPLHWVILPTNNAQQNAALRYDTPQPRSPFWLLNPASEHAHSRLLPTLSWSWTVVLPSDTHRKPNTSITAVLLPCVTYLLTLPRF